jgi:cell division protein FtsI/penicillin-binding protein 2
MNLIAFAAAWKQFYDNVARVVAQNVSYFASSALPTDILKKPESLMMYMLMKQMEQAQMSGLSPEEIEEIDKSVDMERLKKSLEKVKKGGREEEESEKGETKGDSGIQNT